MSANSKIEWTDHTFNPWIGCTKVSPAGCKNCYAEDWAKRYGRDFAARTRTSEANWKMPLRWNAQADAFRAQHGRRQRVFCASLADVFDNQVPQLWRTSLFGMIHDTPNLDWLLLTKRIGNAAAMLRSDPPEGVDMAELPNLWLGATICTQEEADRDIPKLLRVPARVRFLSIEPLLGPVSRLMFDSEEPSLVDWVIVGGESGPQARPMHPDWVRSLRDQCALSGVPFFFKQWGEWKPISHMPEHEHGALYRSRVKAQPHEDQGALDEICGRDCTVQYGVVHTDGSLHEPLEPMAFIAGAMTTFKVGKKAAGRLLDGRTWDEVPQ